MRTSGMITTPASSRSVWIGGLAEFIEQRAAGDVRAEVHFLKRHAQLAHALAKVLHAAHRTKYQRGHFLALPPDDQPGNEGRLNARQLRLEVTKVFEKQPAHPRIDLVGQRRTGGFGLHFSCRPTERWSGAYCYAMLLLWLAPFQ